jgi:EAL and modified HD-GYP domain-containing signal transduction protein
MNTTALATTVYVARQPIFDRKKNTHGYELLFRSGLDNKYTGADGDTASLDVIANTFLEMGLDELTGGKRAFVNFTRNLLLWETADLLPPEVVAVEILEDVRPDEDVLIACRKLKEAGYTLALDDFVLADSGSPFLDFADIVKVDWTLTTAEDHQRIAEDLRNRGIKALAEKVETNEEFEQAKDYGYSYFQGWFFSKPVITSSKALSPNVLAHLRMLQEINRPEMSYGALGDIIKQDVALTYKLLRYINSIWFAIKYKVNSINQALAWLGPIEVRRWFALSSLRNMSTNKPDELLLQALTRAKMAELISTPAGLEGDAPELFLMGMFSSIDALLDVPMEIILDKLPLNKQTQRALLGDPGAFRSICEMITNYEQGAWEAFSAKAHELNIDEEIIPGIFKDSLKWAGQCFERI